MQISEGNRQGYTVKVYACTGERLHNCRPARARMLLRHGRAQRITGGEGFTIILVPEGKNKWNR